MSTTISPDAPLEGNPSDVSEANAENFVVEYDDVIAEIFGDPPQPRAKTVVDAIVGDPDYNRAKTVVETVVLEKNIAVKQNVGDEKDVDDESDFEDENDVGDEYAVGDENAVGDETDVSDEENGVNNVTKHRVKRVIETIIGDMLVTVVEDVVENQSIHSHGSGSATENPIVDQAVRDARRESYVIIDTPVPLLYNDPASDELRHSRRLRASQVLSDWEAAGLSLSLFDKVPANDASKLGIAAVTDDHLARFTWPSALPATSSAFPTTSSALLTTSSGEPQGHEASDTPLLSTSSRPLLRPNTPPAGAPEPASSSGFVRVDLPYDQYASVLNAPPFEPPVDDGRFQFPPLADPPSSAKAKSKRRRFWSCLKRLFCCCMMDSEERSRRGAITPPGSPTFQYRYYSDQLIRDLREENDEHATLAQEVASAATAGPSGGDADSQVQVLAEDYDYHVDLDEYNLHGREGQMVGGNAQRGRATTRAE
ncbi:hypothetical protein P152DRAFT_455064 [Eremomyces bilateralis CBS 781.70]|uniref:Uncharacterized protein n=1 Tax=Eremomyces bilateralis CBS 781.70 TaxID=1392243 RepID=A0A6G1GB79_9PEZI|nr:uncharacterized protein P152DRAFT_455064 [Eremomyces bilateralis CBS 781.70]KAF1815348.1 hypothetical protein P152DRAFT_455064 [Eremomyces bilateralis CBS 781.70]